MARSGNYEVDENGDLVEVGEGAIGAPTDREGGTPSEVRRLLRFYDVARFFAFGLLLAVAIAMPDIRVLLLIVAVAYLLVSFAVRGPYRRALIRGASDRRA